MPDTKHAIEALEKAKLRAQDELRYAGAQGPVLTYIAELDDAIALLRSPSAEVPRVIDDDAISVKAIEVHGETTHAVAFFNGAEWYRDSTTPAPMDYRMSRDYFALYLHLCDGNEALGWATPSTARSHEPAGMCRKEQCLFLTIPNEDGDLAHETQNFWIPNEREDFIAECNRLSLEWLAPSPVAPSVDEQEIERIGLELFPVEMFHLNTDGQCPEVPDFDTNGDLRKAFMKGASVALRSQPAALNILQAGNDMARQLLYTERNDDALDRADIALAEAWFAARSAPVESEPDHVPHPTKMVAPAPAEEGSPTPEFVPLDLPSPPGTMVHPVSMDAHSLVTKHLQPDTWYTVGRIIVDVHSVVFLKEVPHIAFPAEVFQQRRP